MHQNYLLNKEAFIDPFLMERRGIFLIFDGIYEFSHRHFENAYSTFDKGIKYITTDFTGVDVPPFQRAGISQHDIFFRLDGLYSGEAIDFEKLIDLNSLQEKLNNIENSESVRCEITGACFILTYSQDERKLNQALELISRTSKSPLGLYTKIKILLRLDREDEIREEFRDVPYDGIYQKYAAIKYLKLFIDRKENNINYLMSVLKFYLQVPYSSSTLDLLIRYQFNNLLKISYEKNIAPKISHIISDKRYTKEVDTLRSLLWLNFGSDFAYEPGRRLSGGEFLQDLVERIEPNKSKYNSIVALHLFYHLMRKKLDILDEYRLSEIRKINPDYDENEGDIEYEEPYTDRDFIDDVFEGDGSLGWGLE